MQNTLEVSKKELCNSLKPHQLEALNELLESGDLPGILNTLRMIHNCAAEVEMINLHHHQNYKPLEDFVLRLNAVAID